MTPPVDRDYPQVMSTMTLSAVNGWRLGVVWLLIFAGGVDMWTVAVTPYWFLQVGASVVAAIVLIAAGLLLERRSREPALADIIARRVYGAEDAVVLITELTNELVKVTSGRGETGIGMAGEGVRDPE